MFYALSTVTVVHYLAHCVVCFTKTIADTPRQHLSISTSGVFYDLPVTIDQTYEEKSTFAYTILCISSLQLILAVYFIFFELTPDKDRSTATSYLFVPPDGGGNTVIDRVNNSN